MSKGSEMPAYAELAAATNFSFLHGASHGSDMVHRAMALHYKGLGIADRNTVAGVVRAWGALKDKREKAQDLVRGPIQPMLKLVTGARLVFADGTPDIIAYPENRHGWGSLCRMLSNGNLKADKGDCVLKFKDLLDHIDGLLLIVLPESSRREGEGKARQPENQTVLPGDPGSGNVLRFPGPSEISGGGHVLEESRLSATVTQLKPNRHDDLQLEAILTRLRRAAPDRVWLGIAPRMDGKDDRRLKRHARVAAKARVPLIAVNDALYATAQDRPLQDVLTCIRLGLTIPHAGRALEANADRHLKSPQEMLELFKAYPKAIEETTKLLARVSFDLSQLEYEYPHEPVPEGWQPQRWLQHLVIEAAREKWPGRTVPRKVIGMLMEEFRLIRRCNYPYYFLTVHDVVKFARSQEPPILCQGRGSAANSMVCYLLGITSVDPAANNLLFSRFLSEERKEPPDIDVDFEHERREEVMQYIYQRYGRHRAGIVATVIHYRSRSAVREVGKALGLTEDITSRLVSTVWGSFSTVMEEKRYAETGFSLDNAEIARLNHFVAQLLKAPFPRHLSQHVGGYVLTEHALVETVPLHHAAMEDRTFIEWDKDDIDVLGLMKVDILSLGMLTCIRKAFDLIRKDGGPAYTLANIEQGQPDVYDMLCRGDSLGVFQVESRAQMNMLPRLKPRELYDLVVQVAIVRPGPIQGDMVHPYLRRRAGLEKAEFPEPDPAYGPPDELEQLLGKTFGVPLFQEQAMRLAITAAAFTPDEANRLRRAMATFRNIGGMEDFKAKLVGGMTKRGYTADFAERCYKQIEGFGSYGFPESHAQSFALLVYVSSYIKCRYPAAFCAALLNSQPMGFYAPAQIVRDAEAHRVEVRPVDVMSSGWDNKLEPGTNGPAVRLGFRQIDGFKQEWVERPCADAAMRPGRAGQRVYDKMQSILPIAYDRPGFGDAPPPRPGEEIEWLSHQLPTRALRLLADADAFGSLDLNRRNALWEVHRMPGDTLPLFAAADARELREEADARLPAMPLSEEVAADYQMVRLSLKAHPMTFLRPIFDAERVTRAADLNRLKDGARARVAGVVLVRQRPGKGNAIFITLEDETGVANLLLWARDFERNRVAVMAARLMLAEGIVQITEETMPDGETMRIPHLMTARVHDRTAELSRLSEEHQTRQPLARADVFAHPNYTAQGSGGRRHPRDMRVLPKSRDFH
ncbi:error-prone DNA polymerase [Sphingomonas vulcanisoli]|uniref:Error-prone DNA polymerase n=1 Tax=Sphingomonas vulcanisoli TaxID=1658060 RepID=A0ABX0TX01_9SPHN|nr:error-prone DNA polymerase [Sphingomonas vulcanisoli]NIJ08674.1 error-prone DNA polymerase [Sphingomonas vulcanisoli]